MTRTTRQLFSTLTILLFFFIAISSSNDNSKNQNSTEASTTTLKVEKKEFNWYCDNFLGQSVSIVRNKLGKQDGCEGCTEESGELKYYYVMVDAMGTDQTLALTYYKGIITRCRISGSYPIVECTKEYQEN